jgi:hypothetical protein
MRMTATGGRAFSIGGFVFVVGFSVGILLLGELLGQFGDPDDTFIAYYAEEGNRWRDIIGGVLLVVAGLGLLVFLDGVTRRLRSAGGGPALDLALLSGVVSVVLLMTAAAMLAAVSAAQAFGRLFGDDALTNPSVALAPQIGYLLLAVPMVWSLVPAIAILAWSARGTGAWPRWLLGLSVACVILLPCGVFAVMPVVLLPLGVVGVSVWNWRRPQLAEA